MGTCQNRHGAQFLFLSFAAVTLGIAAKIFFLHKPFELLFHCPYNYLKIKTI